MSQINIIRTQQAVYMGDHAQDVLTAVEVRPDETVAQLVERALYRLEGWPQQRVVDADAYITIRLAESVADDTGDGSDL